MCFCTFAKEDILAMVPSHQKNIKEIVSDMYLGWAQCCLGVCGIFASIMCTFYIIYKIEINHLIKKILLGISIQQILSFILLLITGINIFFVKDLNAIIHFLLIFNLLGLLESGCLLSSIISIVRFHFAIKMSKMRIPNIEMIEKIIKIFMIIHYLVSLGISYSFTLKCGILICQNLNQNIYTIIAYISYCFYYYVVISIGLIYDVKMMFFLKDKNKVQPIDGLSCEVPFFSGGKDDLKHSIPRNSSLIYLVLLCFTTPFFVMPYMGFDFDNLIWWVYLSIFILGIFYLPIVFRFTIKKRKSKENRNEVKKNHKRTELKFHEEIPEDWQENENSNTEMMEEIIQSNMKTYSVE